MIEERLEDFMNRVEMLNDKISEYRNEEKGLMYPFNTPQLLCRVDKLELDETELKKAQFQNQVEKKNYTKTDIIKLVPKNEITKIDADKFTLTDKKTKGYVLYNVSNQIGIHNTYEDKDTAFNKCKELNEKVYETLCK